MNTIQDPEAARAQLRAFGERYDYDVSYLENLLDIAPAAHQRFAAAQATTQPRPELPADVHAVASVAVMLTEDCGACAQLNLRMAVEAGVERSLLQTLLDDPDGLPEPFRDVFAHVRQVVTGRDPEPERVRRLSDALGGEAFGELAVLITGSRIYPTLKRALGNATTCRRPTLDF